ncbi:hypothetical protein E3N88_14503 [Mikania micrantha]|uniref:Uncharacterized protein n=1 Tax=Mikania micrantha TaxID=192012 RepID=A0A5N6P3K7_9ASTR|nr:hypothetical protein E3N88_14503 [Mikania micrantha]
MNPSSKPKSSPARTDDFQPPLIIEASIMFPRTQSNRGSRSRSNANRLFIRKIDTSNEPNQEPSSPKVTCIGQVRVKRLNNKQTTVLVTRRCKWVRKLNPKWLQRMWREKIRGGPGGHESRTIPTQTDNGPEGPEPNEMKNKNRGLGPFCVFWACFMLVRVGSYVFSGRLVKRLFLEKFSFFGCECCKNSENFQEPDGTRVEYESGNVIRACYNDLVFESESRNVFLLTRSRSAPYRYPFSGNEICESRRVGEKMVVKEEDVVKLSRCKSEPARIGDKLFGSLSS